MVDDRTDDHVKVRLRFKEGLVEVAGEGLWARPVDAHDGGGTFSLLNNSFYAPLGVGDIVRAEVDGDGLLQITDIVMPSPALISGFMVSPHLSEAQVCAMGDGWRNHGASWSEGSGPILVTIWNPEVDEAQVRATLGIDELAQRGQVLAVFQQEARTRGAQSVVEFELDREQHLEATRTTYWAPDDPYWRSQGLDSPDLLALVQHLATFDRDVARFCERGEHDKVLDVVAFVTGADPRCP